MKTKVFIIILILLIIPSIVQASPKFTLIYVIQEGDTLYDIARAYDISVDSLLKVNNISEDNWIKVGQELIIPREAEKMDNRIRWDFKLLKNNEEKIGYVKLNTGDNYSIRINKQAKLPEVNIPRSKLITYHIGNGDTLFDMARSFNTSVGIIMALNNMDNSVIRKGEELLLPINNLTPHQILEKTIKPYELELLAKAINGEARGESFIGQVAVGAVIINRVFSNYFPDTFKKVIYQPNQFSAVGDGQINLRPTRSVYRAARQAIKGTDPTMGSLYYYNPRTAKNKRWFATRRAVVTIGSHVFTK